MENTGDLSKVISVIMENPELVGQIRSLMQGGEAKGRDESPAPEVKEASEGPMEESPEAKEAAASMNKDNGFSNKRDKHRYRELLCALKPYVTKERAKTIDTFISVIEIVGIMKTK